MTGSVPTSGRFGLVRGVNRELTYVNAVPAKIIIMIDTTSDIVSVTHDSNRQGVHHAR